jgi:ABC-2 type transport system ATP-binding protein
MVELAGEGRTILISSHGISEVERVASHVAFLAEGKLLLSAPIDELRKRIVRVRLRCDGALPDLTGVGTVLEVEKSGKQVQAVLQDPAREALEALAVQPEVAEFEESGLSLEEIYTALLARYHRPGGAPPNGRLLPEGIIASAGREKGERP